MGAFLYLFYPRKLLKHALSTTNEIEDIIDTDDFFNSVNKPIIAIHHDYASYVPKNRWIDRHRSGYSMPFDTIEANLATFKEKLSISQINSQEQKELTYNLGNIIIDADLCPRYKFSFGGNYDSFLIDIHTVFISDYFVDKTRTRYALLVMRDGKEYLKYLIRWNRSSELWQIQDTDGEYISVPYIFQVYLTGLKALDSINQTVNLAQERLLTQSKNLLSRVPNATNAPKIHRKLYLDGKKGADRPNWKWGTGYPAQKTKYGNGDSETVIVPSLKGDIFYTFKSTGELIKVEPFLIRGGKASTSSWLHQRFAIEIADKQSLEKLFANRQ